MAYQLLIRPWQLIMIDALFNQPNYVATKKMLDATVLKHEAIASNLANIETPHYKRIDVQASFQDQLRQATQAANVEQIKSLRPTLGLDPTALASNRDGNNVQLESELMQLNQNTLSHTLETQLVTSTLLKLRLAITGRTS
jgi:flagellar basal-body rod protein FlgB